MTVHIGGNAVWYQFYAAKNLPEQTSPVSSDSILMQWLQVVQMLTATTASLLDHDFYFATFAIM